MSAIVFSAVLGDRRTAIQRSGALEGGGAVTFDVGEVDLSALAALMPLARVPLRITVEVDTETATAPQQEETADAGEEPRPTWAGQRKAHKRRD